MRDLTEHRVSSDTMFSGKVFDIEVDSITLPDGSPSFREVVRHPGGVGILAVDEAERVLLIRQFRYAAGRVVLEIPAGKLEFGESPAECGRRELSEETGFRSGSFLPLGQMLPTPGYCSEMIYLFLARELTEGETNLDEGEFVEPVWIPFKEAEAMVSKGDISDGKTIAALYRYRLLAERGDKPEEA